MITVKPTQQFSFDIEFLTGLYVSQCMYICMYVCYRFSRQPLNRLLWNLAWCFEMVPERQLSILVSIGCVIIELSHNSCMKKGSQDATLRNGKRKFDVINSNVLVSSKCSWRHVIKFCLTSETVVPFLTGCTAQPLALNLAVRHFGAWWMHRKRFIA